jgi:diadenosine tetraphosphate (Ap4A) HIT family hydrolase
MVQWPDNWDARVSGEECGVCPLVRGEVSNGDPKIYESSWVVAFLVRHDIQRGYVIVSCRTHVVEPFDLPSEGAVAYWADVMRVGRAVYTHFRPKKLNYETWGNGEPHLHTHIVPRYEIDPNPGAGFPFWLVHDPPPIPDDDLARDARALRAILAHGE